MSPTCRDRQLWHFPSLGANDPKSGLSNLSTNVSAAVTQSWRNNVVLEAGAGRRVADVLIFLIDNNK